ncbi:MAG: hypothetical protein WBL74_04740 [Novosphingobium sp.]|uniref:hypothetical protein n=1 Tax=Novosphingobium sp. TaxID=1874826 RepID=UPI003C798264
MSWFGGRGDETPTDRRDYGFAFAALKSSMFLALMAAKRGHLMPDEAREHSQMVRDGLSIVPEVWLPPEGREAVEEALGEIERQANLFFSIGIPK